MSLFNEQNLGGSLDVQTFEVTIAGGTRDIGSGIVVVSYRAFGPTSTTDSLTTWQYSMDGGATFSNMTPESAGDLINRSVSPTGALNEFNWKAITDLGSSLFNTDIIIKIQVTDGSHVTPEALGSIRLDKTLRESPDAGRIYSASHVGVPGDQLLANLFGS